MGKSQNEWWRSIGLWISTALGAGIFFCLLVIVNEAPVLPTLWSINPTLYRDIIATIQTIASFSTNLTLFGKITTVILSLLTGFQIALFREYIRGRRGQSTQGWVGLTGMVASIFGVGCAACGGVVLTSLLAIFGASGSVLLWPLHGQEFNILAICILGFSCLYLIRSISKPLTCLA